MAYIGSQPAVGNFVKLDDISTSFNGNTSTFNTTVSGQAYTVSNPYCLSSTAMGSGIYRFLPPM